MCAGVCVVLLHIERARDALKVQINFCFQFDELLLWGSCLLPLLNGNGWIGHTNIFCMALRAVYSFICIFSSSSTLSCWSFFNLSLVFWLLNTIQVQVEIEGKSMNLLCTSRWELCVLCMNWLHLQVWNRFGKWKQHNQKHGNESKSTETFTRN